MTKRRRYDDKFRASAVVMLEAAGYPDKEGALADVARHLSMPHNTLRNWYHEKHNPPPSELRQHVKKSLIELLDDIAYKLIGAMPAKIIDASLQQTATSLAIVIDKKQLLTGKPTEIVEDVGFTDEERANRITAIFDRARERRDRQPISENGNQTWTH